MFSLLRALLLVIVWTASLAAGSLYFAIAELSRDLPELSRALDYRPKRASRVYTSTGELAGEFFSEKRVVVSDDRIPQHTRDAFVAAEDGRFWQHPGFDLVGIARAVRENFESGETRQGASTITQQVAKQLLLSNERTYYRKLRELILSVRIERELTKQQILHIYLNHVFLGRGAYGVQAGAEIYFGKAASQLTISESAMLAGLVQAPSVYNPARNIHAARARQRYVLDRMLEDSHISEIERADALAEPIALVQGAELNHVSAPWFVEHIRQWASARFGHRRVFYDGLRIETSLDPRMQQAAEAAVRDGLLALDRRIGFRGPIGSLTPDDLAEFRGSPARPYREGLAEAVIAGSDALLPDEIYTGAIAAITRRGEVTVELGPERLPLERADARAMLRWRGPKPIAMGDLIPVQLGESREGERVVTLAQQPDVEAALVAIEPGTGRVLAMVGGYDYARSVFNRATQARRQIGSAIKPFIYAAAIDAGVDQLDIVSDSPVSVETAGGVWTPGNYDNRYRGPVTIRTALAKSLNTVSVRLVLQIGVDRVIDMLRAVGVRSPIPRHVSIALGTPDLTLLEAVAGYASFISGGRRIEPRFVDRITDDAGNVVYDANSRGPARELAGANASDASAPAPDQAMPPDLAYLTANLMQAVVARGTGRRAQALGRPTAGKTGTATGYRDAWFIGFTADLVCGVWVGRDDFTPIGESVTGGSVALPIWLQFMRSAHPDTPPREFAIPDDIVLVRADEESGTPLPPAHPRAVWVPFRRGTVPERFLRGIPRAPFQPAAADSK